MNRRSSVRPADIIFVVMAAAIAAASLYGAAQLPAPIYEQLGSAAFPRILGLITLALVIAKAALLYRSWRADAVAATEVAPAAPAADEPRPRFVASAGMLLLTIAYLAVLMLRVLDFTVATAGFLFLSLWLLSGRRFGVAVIVMLVVSALLGVGLDAIFRHFFYVDL